MSSSVPLRNATNGDLPELQRLLGLAVVDAGQLARPQPDCQRYVLVLDAPFGGLAAGLIVSLRPPNARLEALAIDARCASMALEDRLIGVAEALAEAFGCHALDVRTAAAA